MYFTQEDFLKIQEWLKRNSIKDSELPKADSLSREDFVTIVQSGHNKKIEIGKLLENPNILLNTEFNKNIEDESYYHWDIKILDKNKYALKALESKIIFKYCDISQKVVFQKDKFYTLSFSLGRPNVTQRRRSFKINLGGILLNSINTNFEYSINEEGSIEILMNFKKDTFMYITFNTKDKTSDFESIIKFIYDAVDSTEGISIYNIKLEEGEEATSYNLAKEDYSTKYNNQEKLVSGVNIKSISYTNLLGEGNLTLKDLGIDLDNVLKYIGVSKIELFEGSTQSYLSTDLIPGTNMEIGYIAKYDNKSFIWNGDCWNELKEKQDKLVSGTNIKTINNQSILGSGNITIEGGGSVTIVNNLTEGGINKALSAEMGKELAERGRAMTETILGYGESIGYIADVMATKEDLSEYAKSADMITAEPAEGDSEEVEDYVLMKSDVDEEIDSNSNNPVTNEAIARALEAAVARGRELAKRDLYIAAGAEYNDTDSVIKKTAFWGAKVDHLPHHYYLNGLGDITEEQMSKIYNNKEAMTTILTTPGGVSRYFQTPQAPRTLFGHKDYRYSMNKGLSSSYVFSRGVEVVDWAYNNGWLSIASGVPIISSVDFFYQCDKIYAVNTFKSSANVSFSNSDRIRYFRIYGTTAISLNLSKSTIVDKASLLHFIENMTAPSTSAASASVKTITLHPDVYAEFSVDEEINAALVAKNEALSAKNYTLNLVSA